MRLQEVKRHSETLGICIVSSCPTISSHHGNKIYTTQSIGLQLVKDHPGLFFKPAVPHAYASWMEISVHTPQATDSIGVAPRSVVGHATHSLDSERAASCPRVFEQPGVGNQV